MTHDDAERWCREHGFEFSRYQYADSGIPGREAGEPGGPVKPGRVGFSVSGWAWPRDKAKDKARIHTNAPTLSEAVEKARVKAEAVWTGTEPAPPEEEGAS